MSKTIRITESQLKVLLENNKKTIKEQEAWVRDVSDGGDGSKDNPTFDKEEEVEDPKEIRYSDNDVVNFLKFLTQDHGHKYNTTKDAWDDYKVNFLNKSFDVPSIGDESSVESDTPEEYQERHYGIDDEPFVDDETLSESVKKIKSDFRRFL